MPREARRHAPGDLPHLFVSGIKRWPIVRDEADREWFLGRLASVMRTSLARYADRVRGEPRQRGGSR